MATYQRTVGLFYNIEQLEAALLALKNNGFDMNQVHLLAQDAERIIEFLGVDKVDSGCDEGNKIEEGVEIGASTGTILGSLGGLLVGLGTVCIPGIGSIVVAGSTITSILAGAGAGALEGGKIGGLIGLGIPKEKAKIYGEIVSNGGYLIMVQGKDKSINRAERILQDSGIQEYGTYEAIDIQDETQYNIAIVLCLYFLQAYS